MGQYVCDACGWVYDPEEYDGVAFEDQPDDFVCPECGVGKDMFSPLD
jgi:rubredoxin